MISEDSMNSEATTNRKLKRLTIAFCGDIMLGGEVGKYIRTSTVADWVQDVSRVWREADLLIGNLECPCVLNAKPIEAPPSKVTLHASAERLQEMAGAGFSAVTLANNHIMDCGPLGLAETTRGL